MATSIQSQLKMRAVAYESEGANTTAQIKKISQIIEATLILSIVPFIAFKYIKVSKLTYCGVAFGLPLSLFAVSSLMSYVAKEREDKQKKDIHLLSRLSGNRSFQFHIGEMCEDARLNTMHPFESRGPIQPVHRFKRYADEVGIDTTPHFKEVIQAHEIGYSEEERYQKAHTIIATARSDLRKERISEQAFLEAKRSASLAMMGEHPKALKIAQDLEGKLTASQKKVLEQIKALYNLYLPLSKEAKSLIQEARAFIENRENREIFQELNLRGNPLLPLIEKLYSQNAPVESAWFIKDEKAKNALAKKKEQLNKLIEERQKKEESIALDFEKKFAPYLKVTPQAYTRTTARIDKLKSEQKRIFKLWEKDLKNQQQTIPEVNLESPKNDATNERAISQIEEMTETLQQLERQHWRSDIERAERYLLNIQKGARLFQLKRLFKALAGMKKGDTLWKKFEGKWQYDNFLIKLWNAHYDPKHRKAQLTALFLSLKSDTSVPLEKIETLIDGDSLTHKISEYQRKIADFKQEMKDIRERDKDYAFQKMCAAFNKKGNPSSKDPLKYAKQALQWAGGHSSSDNLNQIVNLVADRYNHWGADYLKAREAFSLWIDSDLRLQQQSMHEKGFFQILFSPPPRPEFYAPTPDIKPLQRRIQKADRSEQRLQIIDTIIQGLIVPALLLASFYVKNKHCSTALFSASFVTQGTLLYILPHRIKKQKDKRLRARVEETLELGCADNEGNRHRVEDIPRVHPQLHRLADSRHHLFGTRATVARILTEGAPSKLEKPHWSSDIKKAKKRSSDIEAGARLFQLEQLFTALAQMKEGDALWKKFEGKWQYDPFLIKLWNAYYDPKHRKAQLNALFPRLKDDASITLEKIETLIDGELAQKIPEYKKKLTTFEEKLKPALNKNKVFKPRQLQEWKEKREALSNWIRDELQPLRATGASSNLKYESLKSGYAEIEKRYNKQTQKLRELEKSLTQQLAKQPAHHELEKRLLNISLMLSERSIIHLEKRVKEITDDSQASRLIKEGLRLEKERAASLRKKLEGKSA